MAALNSPYILPLLLVIISFTAPTTASSGRPLAAVKGAYYPSWESSGFPPSAIDTSPFTHIYFAFLVPNNVTFGLEVPDPILLMNFASTLHRKKPPIKTLISISGGGNVTLFARMASEADSRRSFISSTIEVARKFGFDGLDLDWEYPKSPTEMMSLAQLPQEWRAALEKEAAATSRPRLLLTAAVYFSPEFFLSDVRRTYPVGVLGRSLDLINAMCYDYPVDTGNLTYTAALAGLYNPNSNQSTSHGLEAWARAPLHKLIMGLPLYGRSWTLKDPAVHGIGSPAVDVGPGGGEMTDSQVEEFNRKNNATVVFDQVTVSTYSYAETTWIGYDDARSATDKIRFAKGRGLGGYFFWKVNGDYKWTISRQALEAWS